MHELHVCGHTIMQILTFQKVLRRIRIFWLEFQWAEGMQHINGEELPMHLGCEGGCRFYIKEVATLTIIEAKERQKTSQIRIRLLVHSL